MQLDESVSTIASICPLALLANEMVKVTNGELHLAGTPVYLKVISERHLQGLS